MAIDALGQISRGLQLSENVSNRPIRNALAQMEVQKGQQALSNKAQLMQQREALMGRESQKFEQSQQMRNLRILNQSAKALRSLQPEQVPGAYARLLPELQRMGLDTTSLPQQAPTVAQLDEVIASTDGFMANPQAMTEFQRQNLAIQRERLKLQGGVTPSQQGRLDVQKDKLALEREKFGRKVEEEETKKEQRKADQRRQAAIVGFDIDNALAQSEEAFTTGFTGNLASAVPGTTAFDLKSTLDTIKANVGFNKLQEMRENSPTGGALGQVSEQENRLLQSVLGSLEQAQSKPQFQRNMNRLQVLFDAIVHGSNPIPFTQEDYDSIPSGGTFIDPDNGQLLRKP